MTQVEIWGIAIGLAMDCFTVSITGGITLKVLRWKPIAVTALLFGIFQAIMPVIGWLCSRWLSDYIGEYDHWIAFLLLAFLGIKMIIDTLRGGDGESHAFDPSNVKTIMLMAIATSIDALAVGISFAFIYGSDWTAIAWPVAVIGIVSMLMSAVGFVGGTYFSRLKRFKPELIGGMILIGIGLKILIEHLTKGI